MQGLQIFLYSPYKYIDPAERLTILCAHIQKDTMNKTISRWMGMFIFLFTMHPIQGQDLVVYVSDQKTSCQATIDVPIRVSKFRNMLTMQGSIGWDTAYLSLDSVADFGPAAIGLKRSNFGFDMTQEGFLFFSWDDPTIKGVTLPDASGLFTLRFTLKTRTNRTTVITIGGDPVELEFVDTTQRALNTGTRNGRMDLNFDVPAYNPFPDTTRYCGTTLVLDAGDGFMAYEWDPNRKERTLTVDRDGKYRVTVENALGCIGRDSTVVRLLPVPSVNLDILGDTLMCQDDVRILRASGGTRYQWFRDSLSLPNRISDTIQAKTGGRYHVSVTNDQGCSRTSAKGITILMVSKPVLAFEVSGVCTDVPIRFNNRSTVPRTGNISWRWDFGDGSFSTAPDTVINHMFKAPGVYKIILQYRNDRCPTHTQQLEQSRAIRTEPNRRYADVRTLIDQPTPVQARDSGAFYRWRPTQGLKDTSLQRTTATLSRSTTFVIQVTMPNGCIVFDSLLVTTASNAGIHLPKAFTPNGDGQNDRLTPFLVGIFELKYFRVYNRWGNLVFESNNATAGIGWDGFYKGLPQPMDNYLWTAAGTDVKGTPLTARGSTLLIR